MLEELGVGLDLGEERLEALDLLTGGMGEEVREIGAIERMQVVGEVRELARSGQPARQHAQPRPFVTQRDARAVGQ